MHDPWVSRMTSLPATFVSNTRPLDWPVFPVITGRTGSDPVFRGAADFDLELLETGRSTGTSRSWSTGPPGTPEKCRAARVARR